MTCNKTNIAHAIRNLIAENVVENAGRRRYFDMLFLVQNRFATEIIWIIFYFLKKVWVGFHLFLFFIFLFTSVQFYFTKKYKKWKSAYCTVYVIQIEE